MPFDILEDDLRIEKYLSKEKKPEIVDDSAKIEEAITWSREANRVIMIPTTDLQDLEEQWNRFNQMHKKLRRESDWKCLEIFGCTNQTLYEEMRAVALAGGDNFELDDFIEDNGTIQDPSSPVTESYIDYSNSYYPLDSIEYSTEDVEKAKEWAEESNRTIIVPTRTIEELEALWDAFNMMIKKHRRESDWMSEELFGVTNLRHYEYLKREFLRDDLSDNDTDKYGYMIESGTSTDTKNYLKSILENESVNMAAKSLIEAIIPRKSIYEELLTNRIISDVIDGMDIGSLPAVNYGIDCGELPFLSPDDMIDKGVYASNPEENFYGVIADNAELTPDITVKEWFNSYYHLGKGYYTEFSNYASDWINKVRQLMHELSLMKETATEAQINARKQSIIELGWNPEVEFNDRNRMIAREITSQRLNPNFKPRAKVINLGEFYENCEAKEILTEAVVEGGKNLKPVYVIMIEGKSYFSNAIKTITHDIYSHIAISLDPSLHNMYSFGIAKKGTNERQGFRKEDIDDLPIGGRIGVYTFFVGPEAYANIEGFIQRFVDNAEKTSYSYINLFTYLFNIPYNKEWSLICSQFVSRCLQAADINITGKDPSKVSPSDMNKALSAEQRIYSVYSGLASKYEVGKMKNLINALSKKATPLKEQELFYIKNETGYATAIINNINNLSALYEMQKDIDIVSNPVIRRILENVLFDAIDIRPFGEAKEFPIQFDKEGNLLIKNIKKIDFEAEYAKSHKLLKQYHQAKNYEGIKYELSKLWMMSCLIEEKLHSEKFQKLPSFAIESSSAHKARAKILNDFKYYLSEVMKVENDFNFTEYYEASPFSSATIKVNATTMTTMVGLIKKLIKSF